MATVSNFCVTALLIPDFWLINWSSWEYIYLGSSKLSYVKYCDLCDYERKLFELLELENGISRSGKWNHRIQGSHSAITKSSQSCVMYYYVSRVTKKSKYIKKISVMTINGKVLFAQMLETLCLIHRDVFDCKQNTDITLHF